MFRLHLFILCALVAAPAVTAKPTLEDFLKRDVFGTMQISPDGTHIAASIPLEDRSSLVVLKRADLSRTGFVTLPKNIHLASFTWVTDERLLFTIAEKRGQLEQPRGTGEIFFINADGSGSGPPLVGRRAERTGTTRKAGRPTTHYLGARLIDVLKDRPDEVLISTTSSDPYSQVERLNIHNGRRSPVTKGPARYATFVTDTSGEVRFAVGTEYEGDYRTKTYYRDGRGSDWQPLLHDGNSELAVNPIGFSADGNSAFLLIEQEQGPAQIYRFDPASGERTRVGGDDTVDPLLFLYDPDTEAPYAVAYMDGLPRVEYLDQDSPFTRLHRSLQASFPGLMVLPLNFSRDGDLMLFVVMSDRIAGDFFLFDRTAMRASHLAARADWLDPEQLGETRPIQLVARDGLALHGYLTVPPGSDGRSLPLIVNPHGGPFGAFDSWQFGPERQLLATQGYAVLQINFRGSGNYGRAFQNAGYRAWGGSMQDDLTDATRWAIEQGIADPSRICIYGGSYGGYAALMGVAKEPELYRCAVGNVGVYDMQLMYTKGDIPDSRAGTNFLKEVLGKADLPAISPNRLAERIRVPVLLAAGNEDERAPPEHTKRMDTALKRAGVPVETHIYKGEGHGYFKDENRLDYYRRLLAFFDRHIGTGAGNAP